MNNRKSLFPLLTMLFISLVIISCSKVKQRGHHSDGVDDPIAVAYHEKNYKRIIFLADSLEQSRQLTEAAANYWRGYASDRQNQKRTAEYYWKKALSSVTDFKNNDEVAIYTKTASHLTNLMSIKGDYEGTLKVAMPAAYKLEELGCDTTSDYLNLLIFIGCCQSRFNDPEKLTASSYDRAYRKHLENIEKNHSEEAYKNAIAGLINISFNSNAIHDYHEALLWAERFGKLIDDYERQLDATTDYIDKQRARYNIYRATALEGLGRPGEAAAAYHDFKLTKYSKTAEGLFDAGDYLMVARRWDEAADCYQSLDELVNIHNVEISFDNIQNLFLKKYRANLMAGRKDTVFVISTHICDSLDEAINKAKRDDAAELATIYETQQQESKIAQQQAKISRQRQISMFAALTLTLAFFVIYSLYRRSTTKKITKAHDELKEAYDQLEETTTVKERIESELRIARDIQNSMVPSTFPQRVDMDLYASMTTAKEVGGDLYDCLLMGDKLYFCVGDVSGKGVPASLFMAQTIRLFRAMAKQRFMPDVIATNLNEELSENNEQGMFVTMFIGLVDLTSGHLDFCNAGHNQPVLEVDSNTGTFLEMESNAPIGLWPDLKYKGEEVDNIRGRVFFLYTDGLNEAENRSQRQFGEEQLMRILQETRFVSSRQIIDTMKQEVDRHRDGAEPNDDLTMLCLKVL